MCRAGSVVRGDREQVVGSARSGVTEALRLDNRDAPLPLETKRLMMAPTIVAVSAPLASQAAPLHWAPSTVIHLTRSVVHLRLTRP